MVACPSGGHLATFKGTSKTSGLFNAVITTYQGLLTTQFVGCYQTASGSSPGHNWTWIDDTPAANLNCGDGWNGCGLWDSTNPDDFGCAGEGNCQNYCGFYRGLLDDRWASNTATTVLCEYDFPTGTEPLSLACRQA